MRIQLSCLLLVLLCVSVLSQPADVVQRWQKFINQHINGEMSANRCDQVMGARRLTQTNTNMCKETNTFIRATTNIVKSICGRAGEPYNDMTKSLQPFDIVVCQLKNQQARYPHCQYRGQARTRRIAIKCDRGYPVHFDGDIVHFQN